jgi:hypothetical protein
VGIVSLFVSWSLPSNGSIHYNAPSLRLFTPNSLLVYHPFFFSEGCACDICDWSHVSPPWLGSDSDCSPPAPVAPSLRPLGLSGASWSRCTTIILDLGFLWILYTTHHWSGLLPCTGPPMSIGNLVISLLCGLGNRATLCRPCVSPHSWPVLHNEFSSSHWPTSGVGKHNCGCDVDGPLYLLYDQLWAVSCRRVPQTAGQRAVDFSLEH